MVPRIPAEFFMASFITAIESSIQSPCNKVCVVDPVAKLCIGCGRSLDEIACWIDLDTAERKRIMALLPFRLETMSATAKA